MKIFRLIRSDLQVGVCRLAEIHEIKKKIGENMNAATEAMEQAKKEKLELKSQHEKILEQINMDVTALKGMYIETHGVA